MACFSPMHFDVPAFRFSRFTKNVTVPCNYCLSCRLTKSIYLRSLASFSNYMYSKRGIGSSFVTLTYSDDFIPYSADSGLATLSKPDLQNFLKRLRSFLPNDFKNIQYIAAGEYGDKLSRPHYHVSVLGAPSNIVSPLVFKSWNQNVKSVSRGLVDVGALRPGGLSYVTKYCMKQVRGNKVREVYSNNFVTPPFITHSKGMERDFILSELDNLRKTNFVSGFFGRPSFIPSNILKRYCSDDELARYRVSCIRYLQSIPESKRILSLKAKEREAYFNAINSGKAADNTVLSFEDCDIIL